jgi:hypothetical protein
MEPLLLKQDGTLTEEKPYIVSFLADYTSLGQTSKEIFNVLVFASTSSEAKLIADDFMEDKYSKSMLVGDWKIKEVALIPSEYIVHAYTNHINKNN